MNKGCLIFQIHLDIDTSTSRHKLNKSVEPLFYILDFKLKNQQNFHWILIEF